MGWPIRPAPRLGRRHFGLATVSVAVVLVGKPAQAGSYLDRASLLVAQAMQESAYLRRKLYDRELARLIHRLAKARLEAGRQMLVPPEVVQAHPHLLLMLENCERASEAAVAREAREFLKHLQAARDEEELFRVVLKQLGWSLPRVD